MTLLSVIRYHYHMEKDEEIVPRKVFPYIKGGQYKERNFWHSIDEWRESVWVLGTLQETLCFMPSSSD